MPAELNGVRLSCAILMLAALVSSNWRFRREFSFQTTAYQVRQNQRYVEMGLAVERVTTPGATVGVIWAGSIPYYSGRVAIDFLGKSDRYVASLPSDGVLAPGHDKYDLNYSIKSLRPTFVQRLNYAERDLTRWGSTRYVTAYFRGVPLLLLKDSPHVYWDLVDVIGPG